MDGHQHIEYESYPITEDSLLYLPISAYISRYLPISPQVPGGVELLASHEIVLVEGNYLLLQGER